MVENGIIKDSNYITDENGKSHYIGSKSRANVKSSNHGLVEDIESHETENEESYSSSSSSEADDEDNQLQSTIPPLIIKSAFLYENPLPGFIDPITKTEVIRPAISPYGHVLSYDTWLKCLLNGDRKNTCPLTNQPLHKRQLIFLTKDNIEAYLDKIRRE